jgi:hypothetical protein
MLDKHTLETYQHTKDYLHKYLGNQRGIDAMAAWAMSTWIVENFETVRYLCINGERGVGKTSAANVIFRICQSPFDATLTSHNAMLEFLDSGCTMMVDEYKPNGELDFILASGYSVRYAKVFKSFEDKQGNVTIKKYCVFGMKLLVTQRVIQDPIIASKCLTITLRKRKDDRPQFLVLQKDVESMSNELREWSISHSIKKIAHQDFMNALMKGGSHAC